MFASKIQPAGAIHPPPKEAGVFSPIKDKNKKRVQVEIWRQKIVMADGSRLTQFYFLEGSHTGKWGYTTSNSFSR